MTVHGLVAAALLLGLVAVVLALSAHYAHGETADEWFKLVAALEKQERCLYGPDRRFLREMINALAVDDAMPTAAQQRWILSLKKECKL